MADLEALSERWQAHIAPYGGGTQRPHDWFRRLADAYAEPHRHYHTLAHIAEVLDLIDNLADGGTNLFALRLAGWFHDVIYDPKARDNELRSADYAGAVMSQLDMPVSQIDKVKALILSTTHNRAASDVDSAVLLDADLAILGATASRYDEYSVAIRREYAWVGDADFRRGRAQVLRSFLARPRIYATARMFRERENEARANLTREIAALKSES
jgi:predicted metal-dependent HD superfamily phosphohydrolase